MIFYDFCFVFQLMKLVFNDQNAVTNADNNVNNDHDEEEWQVK